MITRRDCILLLSELEAKGVDTRNMLQVALTNSEASFEVVRFINTHREFEANKFYEKLRKSYNHKRSDLYKNIVTCDEQDCSDTVLTTLAALSLQILLFAKTVDNSKMFLEHVRFREIQEALKNYSLTYELIPCIQVLQIIKADLKAFEYMNKNPN